MKSLRKMLSLDWELARYKYSFFGFFNIMFFLLITGALLTGFKIILHNLGNYDDIALFILVAFLTLFADMIYSKQREKNCARVRVYFDKIEIRSAQRYYSIKNYAIFLIVFIYAMFPTNIKDVYVFLFYTMLCSLWIFILSEARIRLSASVFNAVNMAMKIVAYIFIFLYMKRMIDISISAYLNIYYAVSITVITVALIARNFRRIQYGYSAKITTASFIGISGLKLISNDYNLLYIVRKGLFIEPIIVIMMGNIAVTQNVESYGEKLLTIVLSFVFAYVSLYMNILSKEEKKLTHFYYRNAYNLIRKSSLASILKISPFLLLVVIVPLSIIMNVWMILLGFVISLFVFAVSISLKKLSIEKKFEYKKILRVKDILGISLLACIFSTVISFSLEYILKL